MSISGLLILALILGIFPLIFMSGLLIFALILGIFPSIFISGLLILPLIFNSGIFTLGRFISIFPVGKFIPSIIPDTL